MLAGAGVFSPNPNALWRNLLPFKLFDVSQRHSTFTKQTFSHQQSNLSSEEGEKQFPLPILLNTHLFLNRFIMSLFTMRTVQSKNSTRQFIALWLGSFLGSRQPCVPPASLPEGKVAPVLAAGKGRFHTRLHHARLRATNTTGASGVQFPRLQGMCQPASPPSMKGNSLGEIPEYSSSCNTSGKAEERLVQLEGALQTEVVLIAWL